MEYECIFDNLGDKKPANKDSAGSVTNIERKILKDYFSLRNFSSMFLGEHRGSGFLVSSSDILEPEKPLQTQIVDEKDLNEYEKERTAKPEEAKRKIIRYNKHTACFEIPWRKLDWARMHGGRLWVGRTENNQLRINDRGVSRSQGYFIHRNSAVRYADNGSSNGTHVNGTRLDKLVETEIKSGDTILFGIPPFKYFHAEDFFREVLSKIR